MPNRILRITAIIAALACAGCSLPDPVTLSDGPVTYYSEWQKKEVTVDQQIVRMREKWPVGVPLQIDVSLPVDAKHTANDRRLTVKPMFPGAKTAKRWMHSKYVRINPDMTWRTGLYEVGVLPPNATQVLFRVTMKDRMVFPFLPVSWTTLKRPVTQVATIDEATAPIDEEALTSLVTRELGLEVSDREFRVFLEWRFAPKAADYEITHMGFTPTAEDQELVANTSVALRVGFLEQGERVAESRFFITTAQHVEGALLEGNVDRLRDGLANPDGWTVVIESDPEMALLDIANDRYWSGKFERPLSTVKIRPKSQPR